MTASNKVIRIADRLGAPHADVERVRRALAGRFDNLTPVRAADDVEVYLGRDERGEPIQINALSMRAAADPSARESFCREAGAAARLTHPNIVTSSEAEELLGVTFCAVEHKRHSRTLYEVLAYEGWLDLQAAARITDEIASALDYAHQVGVLHLRLQPESILIEQDGWVTVADFGVEFGQQTRRRPRAPYASPEQSSGAMLGSRSDIYSLGAILYEMLTDRTPYDSNDSEYVRNKQMLDAPSPPHLISTGVTQPVSAIVMKALELDPSKRFRTVAELQIALDVAINQL